MASFYAYDFVYDNIPSQKWDLKIITFEDGGLFNGVGSSDINIITQKVLRKSKPYYLGRTQETVLEFPLTFGTAAPISALDRDMISAWLFGRSIYKKLYILQDDLNGAYFNCLFTEPEPLYIGGLNYAFTCNVTCDSPWAYSPEHIVSGSFIGGNAYEFDIYNTSSEDDYLYPSFYFSVTTVDGNQDQRTVSFYNDTDNTLRDFTWSCLYHGDQITIDNDLQIVSSHIYASDEYNNHPFPRYSNDGETMYTLLNCFNKNWFRLLPKNNSIRAVVVETDTIIDYVIRFTERMKIGG